MKKFFDAKASELVALKNQLSDTANKPHLDLQHFVQLLGAIMTKTTGRA